MASLPDIDKSRRVQLVQEKNPKEEIDPVFAWRFLEHNAGCFGLLKMLSCTFLSLLGNVLMLHEIIWSDHWLLLQQTWTLKWRPDGIPASISISKPTLELDPTSS